MCCMYKRIIYVNVWLGPISIVSNAIGCGPCFVVASCHRMASSTWPHKLRYTHTHTPTHTHLERATHKNTGNCIKNMYIPYNSVSCHFDVAQKCWQRLFGRERTYICHSPRPHHGGYTPLCTHNYKDSICKRVHRREYFLQGISIQTASPQTRCVRPAGQLML